MDYLQIIKRNTWVYYVTQVLNSLVFTIPIWIVYYQGKISVAEISYLVSAQYAAQILLELPSGALADLIGRKNTTLIGTVIGAASFLLFPFATSFWHFFVLALMVGVNDSFRSGSEEALLFDTYKQADKEKDFDKMYGNGSIIYQFGLVAATALGGVLYQQSVMLPYVLYGVCLSLAALLTWFYHEPTIDSEIFTFKNYILQIRNGSKEIFKTQYTKYLSLFYIFVGGIAWSSTLYFNEYLMTEFVRNDSSRGFVTAGMRLFNVVLIRSVLQNDKIFGWKSRILLFPIIMIIAYLPGFALDGIWGVPFVQIAMIATTARWMLLAPLTNQAFSSKYRATAISFLSLSIGLVYIVLTTLSAPIISNFGIGAMYSVLGFFTIVSVIPITVKLLLVSKHKAVLSS